MRAHIIARSTALAAALVVLGPHAKADACSAHYHLGVSWPKADQHDVPTHAGLWVFNPFEHTVQVTRADDGASIPYERVYTNTYAALWLPLEPLDPHTPYVAHMQGSTPSVGGYIMITKEPPITFTTGPTQNLDAIPLPDPPQLGAYLRRAHQTIQPDNGADCSLTPTHQDEFNRTYTLEFTLQPNTLPLSIDASAEGSPRTSLGYLDGELRALSWYSLSPEYGPDPCVTLSTLDVFGRTSAPVTTCLPTACANADWGTRPEFTPETCDLTPPDEIPLDEDTPAQEPQPASIASDDEAAGCTVPSQRPANTAPLAVLLMLAVVVHRRRRPSRATHEAAP